MARWLFKQEPTCYAFSDLEREGLTTWDGVKNPQALIHLRKTMPGDLVLFYHTGKEKAVVGVMKVAAAQVVDSMPIVTVIPVRRLVHPVTLATIRTEPRLAAWDLVKNSRLSVMSVPEAIWKRIEELEQKLVEKPAKKKAAG